MSSKAFTVLLCHPDRETLQRVSRLLEAVGYHVSSVCDIAQATASALIRSPDFLIVAAETDLNALSHWLDGIHKRNTSVYTFMLGTLPRGISISTAVEAGVDDFLEMPVASGELLARLRSGARVLEQQRRAQHQSRREALTGLLTERSLTMTIERAIGGNLAIRPASVVVWNLDLFVHCTASEGIEASRLLLVTIAHWIRSKVEAAIPVGYGTCNQFIALLSGKRLAEAVTWAENIRAELAQHAFSINGKPIHVTASFGVAQADSAQSAVGLVREAIQAQRLAKRCGRNCVRSTENVQADEAWWTSLASPERLLERTSARHCMQPWTIALPSTLTIMEADQYLELTHQVSLPVVDSAGQLVGICHRKATSGSLLSDSVTEVTESDIQSFPMDTPFTELCTFFENGGEEYAAIHDGDKLAGYVTRDSVASLMDAIHHDTFADRLSDLTTSDYLRVRDSRFFA